MQGGAYSTAMYDTSHSTRHFLAFLVIDDNANPVAIVDLIANGCSHIQRAQNWEFGFCPKSLHNRHSRAVVYEYIENKVQGWMTEE